MRREKPQDDMPKCSEVECEEHYAEGTGKAGRVTSGSSLKGDVRTLRQEEIGDSKRGGIGLSIVRSLGDEADGNFLIGGPEETGELCRVE